MARELVLDPDGPSRDEAGAGERPADRGKGGEPDQSAQRPVPSGGTVRRDRECRSAGPDAGQGEELEDRADPDPKDEAAAIAA